MFIWKIRSMQVPDLPAMMAKAQRTNSMGPRGDKYVFMPDAGVSGLGMSIDRKKRIKPTKKNRKARLDCFIPANEVIGPFFT